jgi:quercetin dioxygenase-like cupin family protein
MLPATELGRFAVNLQFKPGRTTVNKQFAKAVQESPAFSTLLPNVPGKRLSAIVVTFAPGASSPVHHHVGSIYAYVLTGTIRSENSATGPAREYKAGENFFEPPGSVHLVTANASQAEPASLLAVFIADDGATLTMPGK